MVMPTWLLGRFSVAIDKSAGTAAEFYGAVGIGLGLGAGARIGPVPGSGGTTMVTGVGVGLGGLSPGSVGMLVVPFRYQLLFGPGTTSAGFVYHSLPGTPLSTVSMNVCMPGEATKTPSEP